MPRARAGFTSYRNAFTRAMISRRTGGRLEKTSETDANTKVTFMQVMGTNGETSGSHVCQSRFEAARGLAPPYRPAIAALPGHNIPRRKMASTVASLRVVAPASVASKRGVTLRARAPGTSPAVATPRASARVDRKEPTRDAEARRDVDGYSATSRRARPSASAHTSDAHISARASHAHARLLAPWLTASLPALAPFVRIPVSATPRSHGSPRRARPHDGHLHGDRGGG